MLYRDFDRLHNAIGSNLSILIQWVATFFAGLAVAFYSNWEITLVLVTIMPFIIAPSAVFNWVSINSTVVQVQLNFVVQ